jgi:hypothetical protein
MNTSPRTDYANDAKEGLRKQSGWGPDQVSNMAGAWALSRERNVAGRSRSQCWRGDRISESVPESGQGVDMTHCALGEESNVGHAVAPVALFFREVVRPP